MAFYPSLLRAALAPNSQAGQNARVIVAQRLAEVLKPAVDLVYPPRCPLCGDAIAEQKGLCALCWSGLVIPGEPNCSTCQRPFSDGFGGDGAQCAPCMASPPKHDGIAAGTLYNDASRRLILAFKHGRRIALADLLARLVAARLPTLEGEWLFVPVPLHRSRLWYRGFNQAGLLAQRLSRMTKKPLLIDGLVRTRHTQPLGGLGRKARERALTGSIAVNKKHLGQLKSAQVVLVDDVLTSGATSDACVRALKSGGAKRVIIACFSRVLNDVSNDSAVAKCETPEVMKPRAPRDE